MQAQCLVKFGKSSQAFELRELPDPIPQSDEVLIESEGYGLNFADVMARLGLYAECPPLPTVIGYELIGKTKFQVIQSDGTQIPVGSRVLAFTRFGAYGKLAVAKKDAIVAIPANLPLDVGCALATQYVTAYYVVEMCLHPRKGERALVQAAAGGVGIAAVQLLKRHGVEVFGTAGGTKKCEFIKSIGVDHPIDYTREDFSAVIREFIKANNIVGLDMVVDSIGGKAFGKGYKLLAPCGKIVGLGGAAFASTGKGLGAVGEFLGFGIYHPVTILQESRQLIGVNMLRVADHRPDLLRECLQGVIGLYLKGEIHPHGGGVMSSLAEGHDLLEQRKTIGKLAVRW